MRKLLVPAVAAALLATAPMAFAAVKHPAQTTHMAKVEHTDGTVKTIDAKALTLADGTTYQLSKSFKDPGLKAGDKVTVAWNMSGKNKMADSVAVAK